jgi:hypothetical protein
MTDTTDIWTMLEQNAPEHCEAVQDLYSWSLNYDPGKGPMTLFVDLIGWSEDNLGESRLLGTLQARRRSHRVLGLPAPRPRVRRCVAGG